MVALLGFYLVTFIPDSLFLLYTNIGYIKESFDFIGRFSGFDYRQSGFKGSSFNIIRWNWYGTISRNFLQELRSIVAQFCHHYLLKVKQSVICRCVQVIIRMTGDSIYLPLQHRYVSEMDTKHFHHQSLKSLWVVNIAPKVLLFFAWCVDPLYILC